MSEVQEQEAPAEARAQQPMQVQVKDDDVSHATLISAALLAHLKS